MTFWFVRELIQPSVGTGAFGAAVAVEFWSEILRIRTDASGKGGCFRIEGKYPDSMPFLPFRSDGNGGRADPFQHYCPEIRMTHMGFDCISSGQDFAHSKR